jgi:hypothetical protein
MRAEGCLMTTYAVPENAQLAEALTLVATRLERAHDYAARSVHELRSAATPHNGWPGPPHVPYADRGRIAAAMRAVADDGHGAGDKLRAIADGLEKSVVVHRMNGGRV